MWAEGGLLGRVMCPLKLFEDSYGEGMEAIVSVGVRASVECTMEHSRTRNGHDKG
jgi:hypothetical protein